MVVISFINLKGGVGKTTCCANIAGELARENRRVLVIDADPQANVSILLLGQLRYKKLFDNSLPEHEKYQKTIYQLFLDAIEGDTQPRRFDFETAIIKNVVKQEIRGKIHSPLPHLDLLPSTYHLVQLEQKIVNYVRSRYAILDRFLQKVKNEYDFILIDCPPNIYTTTHNALYASDYFIIPTIPDYISISGISLLINTLNKTIAIKTEEGHDPVKLAGILINLIDSRINVHKEGKANIERLLAQFIRDGLVDSEAIIFQTEIKNLVDIKKASGESLPICINEPRAVSTGLFRELCHEIISRTTLPNGGV